MKCLLSFGLCLAVFLASPLLAQEVPEPSKPTKQHEFLRKFEGQWATTSETVAAPGQPSMKCTATIENKMLGDLWVISEIESEMMGMKFNAVQTIGYDDKAEKYIGTWVDSMMNHMWKYEGSVDKAGKTLTLEAEGPNFLKPGETALYRDVYEFKSKDKIAVSSLAKTDGGEWVTFMTGTAVRQSK